MNDETTGSDPTPAGTAITAPGPPPPAMARLEFGSLAKAWKGEASDFTPLLNEQLDLVGDAVGVELASIGKSEVLTAGGRRIDIIPQDSSGAEFLIENQYGRADHDHLTRGLAYLVARRARGLIVIAEAHRDEFRAVAQYLNEVAENSPERGIAVWLVEARAVRIGDSPWAPLFTAVVEPNTFTATIEVMKQSEARLGSLDEFWEQFESPVVLDAAKQVVEAWRKAAQPWRLGLHNVVLMAPGPSVSGRRTVVAIYSDGRVMVPFGAYSGPNSGIVIEASTTDTFRSGANALFGFGGSENPARTAPGWLSPENVGPLIGFCQEVTKAYAAAQSS